MMEKRTNFFSRGSFLRLESSFLELHAALQVCYGERLGVGVDFVASLVAAGRFLCRRMESVLVHGACLAVTGRDLVGG